LDFELPFRAGRCRAEIQICTLAPSRPAISIEAVELPEAGERRRRNWPNTEETMNFRNILAGFAATATPDRSGKQVDGKTNRRSRRFGAQIGGLFPSICTARRGRPCHCGRRSGGTNIDFLQGL